MAFSWWLSGQQDAEKLSPSYPHQNQIRRLPRSTAPRLHLWPRSSSGDDLEAGITVIGPSSSSCPFVLRRLKAPEIAA